METFTQMMKMNKNKKGQAGFVLTAELLLITVVLTFGLITGWTKLRDQTVAELADLGSAVGAIDNSYEVAGLEWANGAATADVAATAGFGFQDNFDGASTIVGGDGQLITYQRETLATSFVPQEAVTLF